MFLYACVVTQWQRASDQRDTMWRRGGGISKWMEDGDRIFAKWAAVRIGSSVTAIDSELSSQVQLICRRHWSVICSALLCSQANPCDCYWALYALHGEVWLLFFAPDHSIAPAFFFSIYHACASFFVNDLDVYLICLYVSNLALKTNHYQPNHYLVFRLSDCLCLSR